MALSERDLRTLKIGGAVLGVILVGFLLFTFLAGGDEVALPPTVSGPGPGPTDSLTPSPSIRPTAIFTGRDPFSPPAGLTSSSISTSPSVSGSVTVSVTVSPTGSASPTQPGGGQSTVVGGRTIVILDIFMQGGERMVQVAVNGNVHNVGVGDDFGPGNDYMLQSISGNCATFLYGDEPFTLCVSVQK
jgi:hypothetical protein